MVWFMYVGLAFAAVALVIGRRLYRFSTWLKDLGGPKRENWLMGIYVDLTRDDLISVCMDCLRKYGNAVRIWAFLGEPRLLLTDAVALDYIFNKHPYDYPKQKDIARVLAGLAGPGILVAEGEVHKRQRFALQKGFSANSVKALYPFFQHHARHLRDRLIDRIQSEEGQVKGVKTDVYRPLHKTTLDVLGHAAFGHSFNALDEPGLLGQVSYTEGVVSSVSINPLARAFDELLRASVQAQTSWYNMAWDVTVMFFPWLIYLPIGAEANPEKKRARKVMDAEANKVIQRALQDQKDAPEEKQRNDIMSSLLRANTNASRKDEDCPGQSKLTSKASLSDEELLAQITSLQLAGHESTGAQITWLIYSLATNQEAQAKLRKEIRDKRQSLDLLETSNPWVRDVVQDEGEQDERRRELSLEEVDSMEYLDWCIQEVCRLRPAVHMTSRSVIKEDVIPVDPVSSPNAPAHGIRVRPGLMIMIPIEAINRDPALWGHDADTYRPERWSDLELPGRKQINKVGGMAFLTGPRSCIANRFAVLELKAIAVVLINSIQFDHAGHTIKPQRWLTSRPFDCTVGTEQCTLLLRLVDMEGGKGGKDADRRT
ncbi:hypothetical protein CBS101457_005512 [Exobasidium rhododendri]|nr:hypothetical protein CBS101457_005512 [Exobasidium rhododendri]